MPTMSSVMPLGSECSPENSRRKGFRQRERSARGLEYSEHLSKYKMPACPAWPDSCRTHCARGF